MQSLETDARRSCLLALAASRGSASAQSPHLLVIVGLAGDPEFAEPYSKWGAALVDAATTRYGIPKEQVIYLHEKPETDAKRITAKSTRDEVAKAFGKLAGAGADDTDLRGADWAWQLRRQGRQVQSARARHDRRGLRAADEAAGAAPRRVRQHRERQRPVHRSVVRTRPHHRHRHPERPGVVCDDLRRLFRRRPDLGCRRRGQEQAGQRARGVRLRPPRGRDGLRAAGHHPDRARAARRQRRQGRHARRRRSTARKGAWRR